MNNGTPRGAQLSRARYSDVSAAHQLAHASSSLALTNALHAAEDALDGPGLNPDAHGCVVRAIRELRDALTEQDLGPDPEPRDPRDRVTVFVRSEEWSTTGVVPTTTGRGALLLERLKLGRTFDQVLKAEREQTTQVERPQEAARS